MLRRSSPSQGSFFTCLLVLLLSYPSFGEVLIDIKSGNQVSAADLLNRGKVLVYIERGCSICHKYVQDIDRCNESIRALIQIVSVSTPAQTKEMARSIPSRLPLYVVKDLKASRKVSATPTTQLAQLQQVGALSCADLETLVSRTKN